MNTTIAGHWYISAKPEDSIVCSTLVLRKASENDETLMKSVLMSNIACESDLPKDIRILDNEEHHMDTEAVWS